jgi:hypothetical protein
MEAGKRLGKARASVIKASTPPAEVPIVIMSCPGNLLLLVRTSPAVKEVSPDALPGRFTHVNTSNSRP